MFHSWEVSQGVVLSRGVTWLILVSAVEMARVIGSCLVNGVGTSFLSVCVVIKGVGKESLWMITVCHAWFSLKYTSHGGNTDNNRICCLLSFFSCALGMST